MLARNEKINCTDGPQRRLVNAFYEKMSFPWRSAAAPRRVIAPRNIVFDDRRGIRLHFSRVQRSTVLLYDLTYCRGSRRKGKIRAALRDINARASKGRTVNCFSPETLRFFFRITIFCANAQPLTGSRKIENRPSCDTEL